MTHEREAKLRECTEVRTKPHRWDGTLPRVLETEERWVSHKMPTVDGGIEIHILKKELLITPKSSSAPQIHLLPGHFLTTFLQHKNGIFLQKTCITRFIFQTLEPWNLGFCLICLPLSRMLLPSLNVPSLRQQNPKNYEDEGSHRHPDEIFNCVVQDLWGCVVDNEFTNFRKTQNSPHDNLSPGAPDFFG